MVTAPANAPRVAMTLTQDWHRVPGGTAVAANAIASAVSDTGRVELLGVVPRGPIPDPLWQPPVPTTQLALPLPVLYDAWHVLRRPRVTRAAGTVDLIHLSVPIACPAEPTPMVATVHDLLPLTMPEMFSRRGVRLMTRGLGRIREEASLVMVPTERGREQFVEQGFDPGRLRVVPLGVHTDEPPAAGAVDDAMGRHGLESPFVLFVGTAEPRKGLDVLLDAFRRLDRPKLTLALVGPEGWGDSPGESMDALPGRVANLGFVPAADLALLRAGSSVCCLPSRAEGFGLPVLEAMAAGAPVVTTVGSPMEEIAGDAAICVAIGDPTALADALADVIDDPHLAGRLGAEGRRRAQRFTWAATAESVIDVYREALQR